LRKMNPPRIERIDLTPLTNALINESKSESEAEMPRKLAGKGLPNQVEASSPGSEQHPRQNLALCQKHRQTASAYLDFIQAGASATHCLAVSSRTFVSTMSLSHHVIYNTLSVDSASTSTCCENTMHAQCLSMSARSQQSLPTTSLHPLTTSTFALPVGLLSYIPKRASTPGLNLGLLVQVSFSSSLDFMVDVFLMSWLQWHLSYYLHV
jgi:hypothetical protein